MQHTVSSILVISGDLFALPILYSEKAKYYPFYVCHILFVFMVFTEERVFCIIETCFSK